MASCYSVFFCIFTLSLSFHFYGIYATTYVVLNAAPQTEGCIRWEKEVGAEATKATMIKVGKFIVYDLLQQTNPLDQKPVDVMTAYMGAFVDKADAFTWGNNNINVSYVFLKGYEARDLKQGVDSLLCHEMTHIFQWSGEGTSPSGLLEGIADLAYLKANLTGLGVGKLGEGKKWDEGYQVTARFLEYIEEIKPGFVAKLNKMMRFRYNPKYFVDLTGKPVEQLWKDYKAKYPNPQ